ncbi:hypothetical protein [Secundilactobacillus malefermentans]|uniref:hypothetical protein n=1 Tax=Secundilactobacillus malefermentans TaxID=176292 RepID=UPI0011CC31D4|nr:hypothetical protein [Secundilactobacillus malefermentans]QEA32117.1 hypothetical protein FGL90_07940 [Secundilactobacillus malefermentans]
MDMPAKLQVTLPPEYDEQLKQQVKATIEEAIKEARQQTGIDSPWLQTKQSIAKWIGISNNSLTTLINNGMPIHFMPDLNLVCANKHEISEWILKQ